MDWHRLFGLILTDSLSRLPFVVELEKDLSLKKQRLDVVIVRKSAEPVSTRLPDGLEDLAAHNLITFKSHQEVLDDWALKELIGHYVNYRKQVSPSMQQLLPEEDFRLYAVSAHYPQQLVDRVPWQEVQPGVYQCQWGTDGIRVVVLRRLPQQAHNALWHLFSGVPAQVAFGAQYYQQRSEETSTLLYQLFTGYRREGHIMSYTMADFRHDFTKEHLSLLTPEERLAGLSPEEILKRLPPEEILKRLPPEKRLEGLTPEERLEGLPPEEILKRLPPEEILKRLPRAAIENFLKRRPNGAAPSSE